jgi:hypothetical protein
MSHLSVVAATAANVPSDPTTIIATAMKYIRIMRIE